MSANRDRYLVSLCGGLISVRGYEDAAADMCWRLRSCRVPWLWRIRRGAGLDRRRSDAARHACVPELAEVGLVPCMVRTQCISK